MADFTGDMESIPGMGMAPSTVSGRSSAAKMFASFLVAQHENDSSWPTTADELTEEQANSPALYERYAFYLANVVESGRGRGVLALGSAKNYLRAAGQGQANGPHAKPGSKLRELLLPNNWMSKIVDQMVRRFVLRAIAEGTELSSSATPLALIQLRAIIESLARANSPEAAFRAIVQLETYMACGRGGEVATVSWPLVNWSHTINNRVFTWSEVKTHKQYPVPTFSDRSHPDSDVYEVEGNAAIHGQFNRGGPPEEGEAKLLLPQFAGLAGGANKVSRMLKDSVEGAGKWEQVGNLNGDPNFTSHSFGNGATAEMNAHGVPPMIQIDLTGHSAGGGGGGAGGGGGGGGGGVPAKGSAWFNYHNATEASVSQGNFRQIGV